MQNEFLSNATVLKTGLITLQSLKEIVQIKYESVLSMEWLLAKVDALKFRHLKHKVSVRNRVRVNKPWSILNNEPS